MWIAFCEYIFFFHARFLCVRELGFMHVKLSTHVWIVFFAWIIFETYLSPYGCDSAPTRFSVPTLLTLLHKTPWPKILLSSFFLIFFLKREDCNCAGSVGKITLILQKELRCCLHCCWHPCLTLATSANNEWRRWPLSTLLRMRVTSGSFHVHTGDHKRSHLIGNVNGLAKKSNFFKKSELSIKPCSVNVALDILSILDFEIAKYTNKNILECKLKMP